MLGMMLREQGAVQTKGQKVPRAIPDKFTYEKKFRFRRNLTGSAVITWDCLCNLLGVATSSSQFYRLFGTVQLRHIQFWSNTSPSVGSIDGMQPTQLSIVNSAVGLPNTPPQTFQAIGSYDKPGHVSLRPGLFTGHGAIHDASGNQRVTVFLFNGQDGDIIEITLLYTWNNATSTVPHSLTGASGVAGAIFENSHLDNTNQSGLAGARMLDNVSTWPSTVFLG